MNSQRAGERGGGLVRGKERTRGAQAGDRGGVEAEMEEEEDEGGGEEGEGDWYGESGKMEEEGAG